jgi:N-acylneuraminate cytidylyltransferase
VTDTHHTADRCLAIIPARGGSKRVPRKNLRPFLGVPTLVRAIALARRAGCFDEVFVSTDDEEIASLARRHGAWVPFLRSPSTAHDHATTFDVVHEVLDQLDSMGHRWSRAVCLYPTAVLAQPEDVSSAVASIRDGAARAMLPVTAFESPIWRALVADPDGAARFAFPEFAQTRSQDLPAAWHDAGQWYAFDVRELQHRRDFMNLRPLPLILPSDRVQDIDTSEDWERAVEKFARLEASHSRTSRARPWVLFRVDASEALGSGHVMRCLSLAEAFHARGHDVLFVSAACPLTLREAIRCRGFEWTGLDESAVSRDDAKAVDAITDAAATLACLSTQSRPPRWIVVDHYGLDARWERAIRSAGVALLVVDDLADRPHACDALLDQNLVLEHHDRYPSLVPEQTRLLLGGRYALLRQEFQEAAVERERHRAAQEPGTITLFLGGTDSENLTLTLARLVKPLSTNPLLLVLGHLNPNEDAIRRWSDAHGVRVEVGIDAIASRLVRTRLLVGACGMTAVEAQALGIPSLLIPLSQVQHKVARLFEALGRAVVLTPAEVDDPESVAAAWARAWALPQALPPGPVSLDGAQTAVDTLLETADE